MRNSKITEKDKNYGPYINSPPNTLSIGDTQTMYFKPTDPGLFHKSPSEAKSRKRDRRTGWMRKKNIIKKDLIIKLIEMGISDPKGNRKQLQEKAKELNLPIEYTEEVIKEGWAGKPKGSLQILYEQGWINHLNYLHIQKKGQ